MPLRNAVVVPRTIIKRLRTTVRLSSTATVTTAERFNVKREPFGFVGDRDISAFEKFVGKDFVLTNSEDLSIYNEDWLGTYRGSSKIALFPKTPEEISAVLQHCYANNIAVCPQGGNTGLVGGSVPVHDEVILSTKRMNNVIEFDDVAGIMICESGCILQTLDEYVAEHGYMMPIDLAAKGSCQIGGNLATCAGGIRLIRYGTLHAHTLGLEVVLPDAKGSVLDCMSRMRKDNTGYHLPHIFVGSEGTLGIMTKVALTCPPRPQSVNVAFLGCSDFANCLKVLKLARITLAEVLSSFEFLDSEAMRAQNENLGNSNVLSGDYPFYLLVETAGSDAEHDGIKLERFLEKAMNEGFIDDGTIAMDATQMQKIWDLRELVAEAVSRDGHTFSFDLSLRQTDYFNLVNALRERLNDNPNVNRIVSFGHLGDGNLHMMISYQDFESVYKLVYPFVFEWTCEHGGCISAEHGIGFSNKNYLPLNRSEQTLNQMKLLKKTFDPKGILNPYKIHL